ncbi:hypothetical protein SPTER_12530 [Sporomusa termitida]|uniref:Uncharacterized protein n=1 Tax=Sporomusa termitida TaxID=2377 RepID=A0A517DRG5_9FIRM|nr:hypothetical protein SPTER_12530 [Sporomusa termitida]
MLQGSTAASFLQGEIKKRMRGFYPTHALGFDVCYILHPNKAGHSGLANKLVSVGPAADNWLVRRG